MEVREEGDSIFTDVWYQDEPDSVKEEDFWSCPELSLLTFFAFKGSVLTCEAFEPGTRSGMSLVVVVSAVFIVLLINDGIGRSSSESSLGATGTGGCWGGLDWTTGGGGYNVEDGPTGDSSMFDGRFDEDNDGFASGDGEEK